MSQNIKKSSYFQKEIILEFTRELIRHSAEGEISELKTILEKESEKRQKKAESNEKITEVLEKSLLSQREEPIHEVSRAPATMPAKKGISILPRRKIRQREYLPPHPLLVQKVALPPRFQYLKPTPTELEIDLGKLNPLIKDPLVSEIECPGANQKIIVTGSIGRKNTGISLTREEIEEVIEKFSQATKIPVQEGVFRVVAGKFIFTAVVSKLITSKFTIKKIVYNPGYR